MDDACRRRVYRYLDKHFYFARRQRYNLVTFAREHIGVSRNYDVAQLKRQLTRAIEELEERGYLEPMRPDERFLRIRQGEWEVIFVRAAKPRAKAASHEPAGLEAQLIQRGVTRSTAVQLAGSHPAEKVRTKLEVFDQLVAQRDARISKNPAGYLVESIRKDYERPAGLSRTRPANVVQRGVPPETAKKTRRRSIPKDRKQDEQQRQVEQHLASLSPEQITQLEAAALKSAPPFLAKSFRRAVAEGNETLVREYRRCLLEHHLRACFRAQNESSAGR